MFGSLESDVVEDFEQNLIPLSSTLLESIKSLVESKNVFVITDANGARGWFHIDDFVLSEFTIEVGRPDIDLMNFPVKSSCQGQDSLD